MNQTLQSLHGGSLKVKLTVAFIFFIFSEYEKFPPIDQEGKILSCKYCKYSSFSKRSLKRHKEINHSTQSGIKLSCDTCDYSTSSKLNLKKHKKLKHCSDSNSLKKETVEVKGM